MIVWLVWAGVLLFLAGVTVNALRIQRQLTRANAQSSEEARRMREERRAAL
jgi:hypothetical protein